MSNHTNLFEEFAPVSKAEWLAKIEKDLKGKPLADLQFQLGKETAVAPFYHPDDFTEFYEPLVTSKPNNIWEIGEQVEVNDIQTAHAQALEALNGGATALLFVLQQDISDSELSQLLANIELEYISVHFEQNFLEKNPGQLLERFYNFIKANHKNPASIGGAIHFDAILNWAEPPFGELAEAVQFCAQEMPLFRMVAVDARRFHQGIEDPSLELAHLIAKGSEYLAQLSGFDLHPAVTNRHLQFTIGIGSSYFVEIAKIRALKLLWANVLQGYQVPIEMPLIEVHFAPESQDINENNNAIRAATQALSAVLGGADHLYILPSNAALGESSTPFTRRIARNVQHLLQLESHIDKVLDPAAGSYYIEKLTDQLAEQAWEKFQAIEKNGGYLKL